MVVHAGKNFLVPTSCIPRLRLEMITWVELAPLNLHDVIRLLAPPICTLAHHDQDSLLFSAGSWTQTDNSMWISSLHINCSAAETKSDG